MSRAEAGEKTILDADRLRAVVVELADKVARAHNGNGRLALVGIRTGGAFLAQRLKQLLEERLGQSLPCGVVDINLYRDDWTRLGSRPRVGRTDISFSVDDRDILLVDDVLYTGRTVRAALDALIDMGRPHRIELLVLVDRGHRELPIRADYAGLTVDTARDDLVNVHLVEHDGRDEVTIKSGR